MHGACMKTARKHYVGKNDKIRIRCLACKRIRTIALADLRFTRYFINMIPLFESMKN